MSDLDRNKMIQYSSLTARTRIQVTRVNLPRLWTLHVIQSLHPHSVSDPMTRTFAVLYSLVDVEVKVLPFAVIIRHGVLATLLRVIQKARTILFIVLFYLCCTPDRRLDFGHQ